MQVHEQTGPPGGRYDPPGPVTPQTWCDQRRRLCSPVDFGQVPVLDRRCRYFMNKHPARVVGKPCTPSPPDTRNIQITQELLEVGPRVPWQDDSHSGFWWGETPIVEELPDSHANHFSRHDPLCFDKMPAFCNIYIAAHRSPGSAPAIVHARLTALTPRSSSHAAKSCTSSLSRLTASIGSIDGCTSVRSVDRTSRETTRPVFFGVAADFTCSTGNRLNMTTFRIAPPPVSGA